MAIQLDATSTGTATSSAAFSWNHTTAGGNRILVVFIAQKSTTQRTVVSITYNGVAMNQWYEDNDGGAQVGVAGYYLVAPATGSNSIAITMSDVASNTFQGYAISLKGVDQASVTTGTATGHIVGSLSATVTENITTDVPNAWVVTGVLKGSGGTPTPGALNVGMTTRTDFGGTANFNISTVTQTAAQLETVGWDNTNSGTDFWAQATIAFIPIQALTSTGSYAISLKTALLTGQRTMVATVASFTLTGLPALAHRITTIVNNLLNSTSPTNQSRSTASLTNSTKNSSTIVNQTLD